MLEGINPFEVMQILANKYFKEDKNLLVEMINLVNKRFQRDVFRHLNKITVA